LEEGASLRLTSQSSLQVHPATKGAAASIDTTCVVANGARLECHWDPVIPFPDSRLDERVTVQLAPGASLYWSDAVMSGRQARGERWTFAALARELRIVRGNALEYLERYRIEPGAHSPEAAWVAGEANYLGTAIISGAPAADLHVDALQVRLAGIENVRAAVD